MQDQLTLDSVMSSVKASREKAKAQRDSLLQNITQFNEELEYQTASWTAQNDPVTGRPYIAIEDVEGFAWGKRLRFFNRHYIQFVLTQFGVLYTQETDANGNVRATKYDGGYTSGTSASPNFTLWQKDGQQSVGRHLWAILSQYAQSAIKWGELPEPKDKASA